MAEEVAYYRDIDDDVDAVYACAGPAMFRRKGDEPWEFVVPGSPTHNWVHQKIFRQYRAERMKQEDVAALPPLPAIPSAPFPAHEAYYMPESPLGEKAFPATAERIKAHGGKPLVVVVVLREDTYESSFGDGKFFDFRDVFFTQAEAQDFMARNAASWTAFHLARLAITLDEGVFQFPGFKHESYEEYRPEEVLRALEAKLASG